MCPFGGTYSLPQSILPLTKSRVGHISKSHCFKSHEEEDYITELEETEANESPIIPEELVLRARQAHYFLEEIKKDLEPKYGTELLEQGGLTIHTTLDLKMQQAAEEVLEEHLSRYDFHLGTATLAEYNEDLVAEHEKAKRLILKSTETTKAEKKELIEELGEIEISTIPPKLQGALVALDVHTGAIRAMVGGRDFFTSQFNRAVQAKRQPGSSFKPFVWAAALEEDRFTAATVIDDYPLVYIDMESDPTLLAETTTYADTFPPILDNLQTTLDDWLEMDKDERDELMKRYWRPQNYDANYLGPMTLRRGLQRSRNLIAIRIIDSIGPRKVLKMARAAGITGPLNPVLSMSLGTSVASLVEMVNAYSTFASGGQHAQPYYVESITDRRGGVLEQQSPQISQRINPQTAFLITNLLQGVVQHGTGWYAKRLRRPLGGKTGTTQDQRDLLFIGFSPDLACGVWVGYDDFRPLKRGQSSSKIAVPMWTDFMREALKNYPPKDFPMPSGIVFAKIDAETGFLALPSCPKVVLESFRKGTVPTEFCPHDHQNSPQ